MAGYVYLIGTPLFGWYKIGKSITPEVRVKDLGILLPFKLHIISIWKAEDHTLMEQLLHKKYNGSCINGEWFEFTKDAVSRLIESIPSSSRVYPSTGALVNLDRFSNIEEDTWKDKKVIGVRVQKLRGDFTLEEREERRQAAIKLQKEKKIAKESQLTFFER